MEFLYPENRRILAFVRQHEEERILVVANLSRFAQYSNLDLSQFQGMVPVELFGQNEFPQILDSNYPMMLGPHSFLWFALHPAPVPAAVEAPVPTLSLADQELEPVLPAYLMGQRWFRAKSRRVKQVRVRDTVPIAGAQLKVVDVEFVEGDPETYAMPLARNGQEEVVDALTEAGFNAELLEAIARRRRFRGRRGDVLALPTPELGRLRAADHELEPHVSDSEQSNNSVVFGERLILKLFRRLEAGINPDLEMSRFLSVRGFPNVAPVAGAMLYRWAPGQTATLAMLQAYMPNQGDAWTQVLDVMATGDSSAIELYAPYARLLGQRTAEMHVCLSSDTRDPAFAPEPTTAHVARSQYQTMRQLATQVLATLRASLPRLAGLAHADAQLVLEAEPDIHSRLRRLLESRITPRLIRCHGDYHLGQVLFTGGDFVIVDFEGEPARPLFERRLKRWALRDVAGMLRSFDYAAEVAGSGFGQEWVRSASELFLEGYWRAVGEAVFVPRTVEERGLLLEILLLEKALYELRYELDNRPEWVRVPLRGMARILEGRDDGGSA
jgi:maltose alpha-D-glucosyltransferase/alpha-amylase